MIKAARENVLANLTSIMYVIVIDGIGAFAKKLFIYRINIYYSLDLLIQMP